MVSCSQTGMRRGKPTLYRSTITVKKTQMNKLCPCIASAAKVLAAGIVTRTVARVTDAVAVGVQLVGVVHVGAVVAGAADEVVISVGTTRVLYGCVTTCIANAVANGVCLRRVVHGRA